MSFAPIKLRDYVRKYSKNNKGSNEREVTARLKSALARYKAGARCSCGEPIWVIGSAELGNTCFTCATLEADPSDDYEIDEACDKYSAPRAMPDADSWQDAVFIDSDPDDHDVPF